MLLQARGLYSQLRCLGRRMTQPGTRLLPPISPATARGRNRFERLPLCRSRTTIGAVTSPGQDSVRLCDEIPLTFGHKVGSRTGLRCHHVWSRSNLSCNPRSGAPSGYVIVPLPLWAPRDIFWAGAPSGSRIFLTCSISIWGEYILNHYFCQGFMTL